MKEIEDMNTILNKREVSLARVGPRELKDPRSREYAIQTLYSLKRVSEMLRCDHERVQKDIAEIEQYRHWEVLGYESKEAMFAAELSELGRMNVTAAQRGQEAAKATTGEVLPPSPGINQHTPPERSMQIAQTTQATRAEASGVSRRTQVTLDALARSRPDLLEAVRAGIMSAHCAAVEAGIVKPTWSAPVNEDDLERALAKRYPGWRIVRVT
jgi:hypothetical protein